MNDYGYNDPRLVKIKVWTKKNYFVLALALLVVFGFWLALDYKLLFGGDWLSATYDNQDWHTNEGNLHTYGAWDLETHIWKTEYIMENFPNFHWNPYWYLGMPLLKYYQLAFYAIHIAFILITGINAPRSAILLVIFSHLLATILTFALCYKVSRKIWVAALCSIFLLANTFISLRSYGWEPISVVFLFLYPLGLLIFLQKPLKPLRLPLIIVLGISYLCHPLIWFSLCMTFGLYLFSIAVRQPEYKKHPYGHYIWRYLLLVLLSLLVGAVQFFPQLAYQQVTSGAHMGVSYLPFYHVRPNIIDIQDFMFDAGNLKGPGPIIMIACLLFVVFAYIEQRYKTKDISWYQHEIVTGFFLVLLTMVLFYYMELFDLFPMNVLRSIQYHRIIPEFIIAAAVLIASISNLAHTQKYKIFYHSMLIVFVLASTIIIYNVQSHWQTSDTISNTPEFISNNFSGRMSFPYTDQSLAVRNSFTKIPQTYGYYEQGITSAYDDEIFSVSSGYHNENITILYLKAANVARLYVNMEEGERDQVIMGNISLPLTKENDRYSYYEIPLTDTSLAQAVDNSEVANVQSLQLGCRVMFQETYCGSAKEEFVSNDYAEIAYLTEYVKMLDNHNLAQATATMNNPDYYTINVRNASNTSIVVKMNYDSDFVATVDGQKVKIEKIGPDFMLITPNTEGDYQIELRYKVSKIVITGLIVSIISIVSLVIIFTLLKYKKPRIKDRIRKGDM